jgi:outer membrane protein assembly factor BamA
VSYERIAGRISNENLWGTGKVISLEAGAVLPIGGFTGEQYYSRLVYADPRLFDSKKYFLIGSARYNHAAFDYPSGGSDKHEIFGLDLTIGRRIFDFSYLTLGYFHNATSIHETRVVDSDGTVKTYSGMPREWLVATYGWNTEDDPFFPTRGSRAQVSFGLDPTVGLDSRHGDGAYRQTWTYGNSIWTLILGTAPGIVYRGSLEQNLNLGFSYARSIAGSAGGEIRRGRWYIEPGQSDAGNDWEVGIKAGVRLETKSFGIVDVYFFGSKFVNVGGGP